MGREGGGDVVNSPVGTLGEDMQEDSGEDAPGSVRKQLVPFFFVLFMVGLVNMKNYFEPSFKEEAIKMLYM